MYYFLSVYRTFKLLKVGLEFNKCELCREMDGYSAVMLSINVHTEVFCIEFYFIIIIASKGQNVGQMLYFFCVKVIITEESGIIIIFFNTKEKPYNTLKKAQIKISAKHMHVPVCNLNHLTHFNSNDSLKKR